MPNTKTGYTRERQCEDCQKFEIIRKDNKSKLCSVCAASRAGKASAIKQTEDAKKNWHKCSQCGTNFVRRKYKYCSVECKVKAVKRTTFICNWCERKFQVTNSKINAANKNSIRRGVYCSKLCMSNHQTGVSVGYTPSLRIIPNLEVIK